jgi:hypothetical protein
VHDEQRYQSHFHVQLNQVAPPQQAQPQEQKAQFHRPFSDGDFEFVSDFRKLLKINNESVFCDFCKKLN